MKLSSKSTLFLIFIFCVISTKIRFFSLTSKKFDSKLKDHYHLYANIILIDNTQVTQVNHPLPSWIKYKVEYNEENINFKHKDKNHVNFQISYENLIFKYDRLIWTIDDVLNYNNGDGSNFFSNIKRILIKIKVNLGFSSVNIIPYYNSTEEIKFLILSSCDSSDHAISDEKVILNNLLDNYVEYLKNKKLIWKGQQYDENEKLNLFHWSQNKETIPTDILNSHRYTTYFTDEGIIINEQDRMKNNSFLNYSFRYDQIINCEGYLHYPHSKSLKKIKKSMPVKLLNQIKNFECCVGYNTDWDESPNKELFCSNNKDTKSCNTEIILFSNTLFYKCINFSVIEFFLTISGDDYNFDKFIENLPYTQKIRFYYLLLNLRKHNIIENKNDTKLKKIKVFLELFDVYYDTYFQKFQESLRDVNIDEILFGTISDENTHPEIDRNELKIKLVKNLASQGYERKLVDFKVNQILKVDDLLFSLSKILEKNITLPFNIIKDFNYLNIKQFKNRLNLLLNQQDLNFIMKNEKGKTRNSKKSLNKSELAMNKKNSNTLYNKGIQKNNQENKIKFTKSKFNNLSGQSNLDKSRLIKEINEYMKNLNENDVKYLLNSILQLKNKKINVKKTKNQITEQRITKFKIEGKGKASKLVDQIVKQIMQNKKIVDDIQNKNIKNNVKLLNKRDISPVYNNTNTIDKDPKNNEYIYNLEDEDDKQVVLLINKPANENKNKLVSNSTYSNRIRQEDNIKPKKSNLSFRKQDNQKSADKSNAKILNKEFKPNYDYKSMILNKPQISNNLKSMNENLALIQDDNLNNKLDNQSKSLKDSLENRKIEFPIKKSNFNQTNEGEVYYNIDEDEDKQISQILDEIHNKSKFVNNDKKSNLEAITEKGSNKTKTFSESINSIGKNTLNTNNNTEKINSSLKNILYKIPKYENYKNKNSSVENILNKYDNVIEDQSNIKNKENKKYKVKNNNNKNYNEYNDQSNSQNEKGVQNKKSASENFKNYYDYASNYKSNSINEIIKSNNSKNLNIRLQNKDYKTENDYKIPRQNIENDSKFESKEFISTSNKNKEDCISKEQMKQQVIQNQRESYEITNANNLLNRIKVFNHIVDPIPIEQIHVVNAFHNPQVVKLYPDNMLIQNDESPFIHELEIINHNDLNYGI